MKPGAMWTPYMIEILLHHHCSTAKFPREDAPAYRTTVEFLVDKGVLFRAGDGTIRATDCGAALVRMWCDTPLPVPFQQWRDPRFTVGGS